MGERVSLTSKADGFVLGAYHVAPEDARHGGLVLVQEIFGVTEHIRELCDGFAADGYEVIAPAFYDRQERGFEAGYDADGVARGRRYSEAAPWDQVQGDLQAAIDALKGPVNVVGFCWGGTAAWLAACRCDGVAAASCYYGRRIPELIAETPRQYVDIAVQWAADLPRLRAVRAELRQRLRASPLMDGKQYAADVDAAYRQMWKIWCSR